METRLIYTIGQRDVQLVFLDHGVPTNRCVSRPGKLAEISGEIRRHLHDGKTPQYAVLHEERFEAARAFSEDEGVSLEDVAKAFEPDSGVYFCFPIFERAVRHVLDNAPKKTPLVRVDFINTDRQAVSGEAGEWGAVIAKEPYAFQDLLEGFAPRLVPDLEATHTHIVCPGMKISEGPAFEDLDGWLMKYTETCPGKAMVYLAATAGMPPVTGPLKTLASLHVPHRGRRLEVIEQRERLEDLRNEAYRYEQFYRHREVVIRALQRGDFETAAQELRRDAMGACPVLERLAELAAAGLAADGDRIKAALDACAQQMGEDNVPDWYDAIGENPPEADLLVSAVNAAGRGLTSLAAVLFVSALEALCKQLLKTEFPGALKEDGRSSYVLKEALPPRATSCCPRNLQATGNPETYPQNFFVYEWLLEAAKGRDHPFRRLVRNSEGLRKARNNLIHEGKSVPPDTLARFLQCEASDLGAPQKLVQTPAVKTMANAVPGDGFQYWPGDAAKDLIAETRTLRLVETFAPEFASS